MNPNVLLSEQIKCKAVKYRTKTKKMDSQSHDGNRMTSSSSVDSLVTEIHEGYLGIFKDLEERKKHSLTHDYKVMTANKNATLNNISQRKEDLIRKTTQIKEDNQRLRSLAFPKQSERQNNLPLHDWFDSKFTFSSSLGDTDSVWKEECDNNSRKFSVSLYDTKSWQKENNLDLNKLRDKSNVLQHDLNHLTLKVGDQYEKKEKYQELKDYFFQKEKSMEEIGIYNEQLKSIQMERKQQIQILREELADQYPDEKPSIKERLPEPLLPLLEEKKFDSYEPQDQKLVHSCIMYVNRFNKEFQQQNYKLAAQLAANSPRGILRNYTTFLQFKNATDCPESRTSPVFLFCEALIRTSFKDGTLHKNLSIEIISCAIKQCDINLVKYWLNSVILSWSKEIGDLIAACCKCVCKCQCGWTMVALQVYLKINSYESVVLCHLKFNNFKHVRKYMKLHNISAHKFKDIVSTYPHIQLAYLLSGTASEEHFISLAGVISVLLDHKINEDLIFLLTSVYKNGLHGKSLLDCLLIETFCDNMGEEKWGEVLNICIGAGYYELAEELYACLVLRHNLNNAAIFCLRDYIS